MPLKQTHASTRGYLCVVDIYSDDEKQTKKKTDDDTEKSERKTFPFHHNITFLMVLFHSVNMLLYNHINVANIMMCFV